MKISGEKKRLINNACVKYFFSVIFVCFISTLLSIAMNKAGISKENTLMVFIVGVLTVTIITRGYIYSASAAIINVLMFNFLFTEPIHSFEISNTQDIILIIFFLTASLISSTMTTKLQFQTEISKRNEKTAKILYEITKDFINVTGNENTITKGIKYIKDYLGYDCYVILDSDDKIYKTEGIPDYEANSKENIIAIPIKGVGKQRGTVQIIKVISPLSNENYMIVKTIVYQMAIVLDREFMYDERQKIKMDVERERLKSTLLRSISHDIRTPLTSIKGASELILDSYENLDTSSIKKLTSDIYDESIWLIKTVQNILDMTRISEGRLTITKSYEAVDDIVNQALTLVQHINTEGRLQVSVPDEIILVPVDGRLIVQVLVNLLDNAYKHAGEEAKVLLNVDAKDNYVIFEVSDNGKGINPLILDNIFDGFVSYHKNDIVDGSMGVGIGLTICKEIVNAHKGTITASNLDKGGAKFTVVLPLEVE
ncbi:ATP-binding protein [Sedimentibacter sp.]|uniref:ATP-binding protein n=1 Tax=Sedimentibacter sp. TaxID=1960295 RepID=UPI0028ADCFA8|nr:ATP-binding protein [Sedimentibacter sp.]